jgi:hypothetical protein
MTNKKFLIGMAVLLSASLFFLGCPTDTEEPDGGGNDSQDPVAVSGEALVLTSLVVKPVKDAAPKSDDIDATAYTGKIAWQTADGNAFNGATFAAATVYKAVVTLTAKSGYTFAGVKANAFTHADAASAAGSVANVADSGTVTITFPETGPADAALVSDEALNLTALVDKPETDGTPDTDAIDATEYTGTIAWTDENDNPFEGATFAAGTVYKAVVTLTAKSGYTFVGVQANAFTHDDADSNVATPVANATDSGTVTITFPETDAAGDTIVGGDALDLTALVVRPVKNAEPKTDAIDATEYTGSIAWTDEDGAAFNGATFEAGTVYKAVVTLAAKTGFTFTGVLANAFSHDDADNTATPPVANTADSGVVTITFPATVAADADTPVSNAFLVLTSLVTKPAKGGTVQTEFAGTEEYTGSIAWTDEDDGPFNGATFAAGTVYKAVVTLATKTGFTFVGVLENTFTHADADSNVTTPVANAADSGTVTITFPKTEEEAGPQPSIVSGDALVLTSLVVKPVKDVAPKTDAIDTDEYAGTIAWTNEDGEAFNGATFAAGTVYKAVVTLTAKSDYTFVGVLANAFSHADADNNVTPPVANTADSGIVTITFPKTDDDTPQPQPSTANVALNFGFNYDGIPVTGTETDIALFKDGSSVTLTVDDKYVVTAWYVDGKIVDGTPANTFVLNPDSYNVRKHNVTVEATKDGKPYSKTVPFTVAKAQ